MGMYDHGVTQALQDIARELQAIRYILERMEEKQAATEVDLTPAQTTLDPDQLAAAIVQSLARLPNEALA